jgi:hypothetical protein
MTGGHDGTPQALGTTTASRRAAEPPRLGDRGAVAFEFALIFPVMLAMFWGIFGIGVVMIDDMQLNFVVEQAAKAEVATNGTGAPWANGLLGWEGASFNAVDLTSCGGAPIKGAQVTGVWPMSLGIFPSLTLQATATACSP